MREVLRTLLLAVAIYVGVRALVLPYQVEGASMNPNLQNGERLFINPNVYVHFDVNRLWNLIPGEDRHGKDIVYPFHAPHRGEIVVFNPPASEHSDKPYIKRVIGLPGETVAFHGGYVYVDGTKLDEPYIKGPITECGGANCAIGPIPPGMILVLGDNREHSEDSRAFGLVGVDRIIGKAWFANWPLDDIGLVPHQNYPDGA